jgi:DNA-binding NarL/FixJ family response regulator
VLLADDQDMIRTGIGAFLESFGDISASPTELHAAVQKVHRGEAVLPSAIAELMIQAKTARAPQRHR